MEDIYKILRVYGPVNLFICNAIAENLEWKQAVKPETFQRKGRHFTRAWFVVRGIVRVYDPDDASEPTSGFYLPGSIILAPEGFNSRVAATEQFDAGADSLLAGIHHDTMIGLMEEFPELKHLEENIRARESQRRILDLIAMKNTSLDARFMYLKNRYPDIFGQSPIHHIASFMGVGRSKYHQLRKKLI